MQERLKWKLVEDKSCELLRNPKRKAGQRGRTGWREGGLNVSLTAAKKRWRSLQDLVGLADGSVVHPNIKDA